MRSIKYDSKYIPREYFAIIGIVPFITLLFRLLFKHRTNTIIDTIEVETVEK